MPITAQQALQQAIGLYSGARLNSRDTGNPAWVAAQIAEIENGQFDTGFITHVCGSQAAPNLVAVQTDTGLALATAQVGVTAAAKLGLVAAKSIPVVGSVIAGVQLLVGLISAIFAHHAAAVKRDTNFFCTTLPAVNNAFQVVNAALASGQTTPDAASQALDAIYSQFMTAGGAQSPTNIPNSGAAINKSPYCNSNCEVSVTLKAMILYWKSQYAAILPSPQLPAAPAGYPVFRSPGQVAPYNPPPVPVLPSGSPGPGSGPSLSASMASGPSGPANVAPSAGYGPLFAIAAVVVLFFLLPYWGK